MDLLTPENLDIVVRAQVLCRCKLHDSTHAMSHLQFAQYLPYIPYALFGVQTAKSASPLLKIHILYRAGVLRTYRLWSLAQLYLQ
jgi:hypothetical protein